MKKSMVFLLVAAIMLSFCALAHPGRTDSSGGHKDSSTGEYHYHHGYPAHQHTNGECPYDFKDKTGSNSGTSGSSSTVAGIIDNWIANLSPTPTPTPTKQPAKYSTGDIVAIIFLSVLGGPWVLFIIIIIGGLVIRGLLNFVTWVICRLADSRHEYMTYSEEIEHRKDVRRWRIMIYCLPCGLVAMALVLLAQDQNSKVTDIWVPIGVAITIGICWGIERLLALLFHLLAKWARKYREKNC